MATELKMKRSSVASKIPTTSQLELGEIAINTYDGKVYIKKDDGTASIVEVGANSAGAVFNRDSFVATSGQTNFVCTSALSNAYVYLNGLLLNPTADYTISGSTIVLNTGANLNDEIEVFSFGAVVLDDITATYTKTNYTATANQSSITVNYNVGLIDIYLNGVKLIDGSDYTATNGTSVTFTNNLSAGDSVEIISWNATNIANRFDSFTYYGKAAEAISTGDLVMFGGAQGDHLLFKKADSSATGFIPQWVIGVAATDIPLNAFGNVTSMGIIYGVNTSSYSVGDLLYMDHNTAGALTATAPTAPDHNILVAAVTRVNANTGQIVVRITHQPDTDEVEEGSTNLYYTDARVDSYVSSGSLSALDVAGNAIVDGNVGIGTSSPASKLEVVSSSTGGAPVFSTSGTDHLSAIIGTAGGGFSTVTGNYFSIWHQPYADRGTQNNLTERMRIDSSGFLLVGKTTGNQSNTVGVELKPQGIIVGTADSSGVGFFNRKTSDGDIAVFRKDNSTVGSISSDNGKLVVNSQGSNLVFAVGGTVEANLDGTQFYPQTDGGLDLGHPSVRWQNGRFTGTVDAANFNSTSDATLKTNVETLSGSLDAVMSMRGVSFDWIENGNPEIGVIAQEVEEVLPELVNTNDNGIKSVKYGNIVAVLIEAIKEQQEQIDELKAQLNS